MVPLSLSKMTRLALKTLGQLIKVARQERGFSQHNLAQRLNVSRYSIIAIEKGDPKVAIGIVFEAATVVGVPLVGETDHALKTLHQTLLGLTTVLPVRVRSSKKQINNDF